jgi:hypothetical protein
MHVIVKEKRSLASAEATRGKNGNEQSVEELNTATTLPFKTKDEEIEQAGGGGPGGHMTL